MALRFAPARTCQGEEQGKSEKEYKRRIPGVSRYARTQKSERRRLEGGYWVVAATRLAF